MTRSSLSYKITWTQITCCYQWDRKHPKQVTAISRKSKLTFSSTHLKFKLLNLNIHVWWVRFHWHQIQLGWGLLGILFFGFGYGNIISQIQKTSVTVSCLRPALASDSCWLPAQVKSLSFSVLSKWARQEKGSWDRHTSWSKGISMFYSQSQTRHLLSSTLLNHSHIHITSHYF